MATRFLARNEHSLDRLFRILLGIGLLSIVFIGPEPPWGWLGLIPLVTGIVGSCPLYSLFGISTCPLNRR